MELARSADYVIGMMKASTTFYPMSGVSQNRLHQKAQQRRSLHALEDIKAL